MQQKNVGYLFISIAVLELSLLPILSTTGATGLGTIPFLFLTFLTSTAVMLALLLYKRRMPSLNAIIRDRRALLVISVAGLLNFAIAQIFLTFGVLGANPVIASLVLKMWPILMAMMLPFALKTSIRPGQFLALAIGMLGVYLLITGGTLSLGGDLGLAIPILLIVVSTLATATSNVIIRAHNYDMYVQLFLFNLMSLLLFSFLLVAGGSYGAFSSLNTTEIVSFLFLGCLSYGIGAFMFFYALKILNPVFVGNATYATPFLTIIFSSLLLGTRLYGYYFYAAGLIIVALLIQQRYATKAQKYMTRGPGERPVLFDVTGVFVNNTGKQISSCISGNRRALAIKMNRDSLPDLGPSLPKGEGFIMFTSERPHYEVLDEEMKFVNEIVGKEENEVVVVGIGNIKNVEDALISMPSRKGEAIPS